jgi:CHAT domain-containing protein
MLSEKPNVDPSGNVVEPTASFQRRAIYSDYDSLIAKLLVQLRADQPDLTAADIPPSLEEIQGSLRDNEVVIGAPPLVGGLMGHLCISRTMVRFVTSTEDLPRFSRDIRILEAALSSENQPSEEADREYPIGAARHLYDTLLKPVDGCFHPGDSVVWVGAGPGTVPLAALLSQGTVAELQSKRLAEWPWFVSEASISQVSTLSTLVALRRGRRASVEDATAQFLGIGDPDFSGLPDSANEVAQLALRGAVGIGNLSVLPELPDTRTEIVSISTLFPGRKTLLLGNQATEGDLRRLPLERYAYLEFATHGLVRQDISGLTEPALALSPVSSVDSFDDGLLTASEIADLPLNAKFVALSACNTGVLDTSKFASEVPGLAAAFEVAGVPATLGTLWPVDSDASRQIVQDTFRRVIGDRVGPAVALAEAQRQYLRHSTSIAHEHPRFWAPFAIFGDGTAPTGESIESSPVQIGAVRLLTDTGGEVFSLTDDGAGSLFLRAIGDIRSGPRHASLTIGLRKDFSVKWAKEDPVVGSSPVATRVDGGHIVAGYRGDGDTPSVATIQFMDDSGQIQQEWNVARPSEDMLPMSGLRVGSRGALIAIYQHVRNPDANGTWPSSHVVIVEVQVGQPLRVRTDLEVGTDVLSFVGLQWLGNDVLVVTADSNSLRLPKLYLNDYHQMMPCGLEPHSSIAVLQHGTLSKIWSQDLPDVQFANTLRAGDGSVRIVGSEVVGCGDGTRIGLWNISNDRVLTKVFLDQTPRESQARGLLQKPDGSMLLLGRSRRTTDVDSLEERDPQKVIANTSRRMNVSFSSRHIDDAVIISLDRSLNVKSRVTLRAGSDLSMAGAISLDDDTWLYGALGNQAAIMQVTGLH